MKNTIIYAIVIGLCIANVGSIHSQNTDQKSVLHSLQQQLTQFKKTLQCAWNTEGCSKEDVDYAQTLMTELVTGAVLAGMGVLFIAHKGISAYRLQQERQGLEDIIFPASPKAEVDITKMPRLLEIYIANKDVVGLEKMFATHKNKIPVTKSMVDDIARSFAGSRSKTQALYKVVHDLASHGKLDFAPSSHMTKGDTDRALWSFFKSQQVTPQSDNVSFYHWAGMEQDKPTGFAVPRPGKEKDVKKPK